MPAISIVIPVYNVDKYLRQCLNSLVTQTFTDLEIICVNDGSTDSSLSILREYAQKDSRIKIIDQENQGPAIARNIGLNNASGDYIQILDGDDVYDVAMCEKMYKIAIENDLDIAICHSKEFDNKSGKLLPYDWYINDSVIPKKRIFNRKDIPDYIIGFCQGWSWDKLYRREFIESNNLRFQNLRNTDDMFFVMLSLCIAERISVLNDILVYHRTNLEGSVSSSRDKDSQCFIDAIYLLKKSLEQRNLYTELERSFINWNVEFCFWHLDTLQITKNKKNLIKRLKKEVFPNLYVYSFNKEYFYNSETYKRVHDNSLSLRNSFMQKVFSIKKSKDKTHKIITILGIQIKYKIFSKNKITLGNAEYYQKCIDSSIMIPRNIINIVFAIDDNYIQQCAVTIVSILANSYIDNFYNFYILNTSLKNKNKQKLNSLKKIRNFNIEYIDVSKYDVTRFPLNRKWISAATYYRLYIADVLPKNIQKCIYLDCDMIVEDDLLKLWQYNIENYIAGVVEDESSLDNIERLGLSKNNNYFNAGMIIFNLKKIREMNLYDKSVQFYNENKNLITMQDQDILNGVFNGKCLFLPLRWNTNTSMYIKWHPNHNYSTQDEDIAASAPGIIHYTGIYKPWLTSTMHPLRKEYLRYLKLTNYKMDISYLLIKEFISKIYVKKVDWRATEIYLLGIRIYRHRHSSNKFLQKIFSVRNSDNRSHKVISICGLKIKFKRRICNDQS